MEELGEDLEIVVLERVRRRNGGSQHVVNLMKVGAQIYLCENEENKFRCGFQSTSMRNQ